MPFSSSKLEAPEITGSLFGTSSWALSASWAPGGSSDGVAYQTAQSGTLFDVTIAQPGSGPAESRSIGGDLQPGDMNVLLQTIFGSESFHLVYKISNTGSVSPEMGGTGQPKSRVQGGNWQQIITSADPITYTYLPAASSSVEGAIQGSQYHSGSATTGSIYYATNLQKHRVYKGLGNGGWQDLVTTGSGGTSGGNLQAVTTAGNQTSASVIISGGLNVGTNAFASAAGGFAQGNTVTASGNWSHAQGERTLASGQASHAEGNNTVAIGNNSHAEGSTTTSIGFWSHAEGASSTSVGNFSHAEGNATISSGQHAHSEGISSTAAGQGSHAEGGIGRAFGQYAHAEGFNTTAFGDASHAEGQQTFASASYSHAEGFSTTTKGTHSHAEGQFTIAAGIGQTVVGIYNQEIASSSAFIIGDGTSTTRKNLLYASGGRIDISGSLFVNGTQITPSAGGAFPFTGSAAVSGTFQLDTTGSQINKFSASVQGAAAFGANNEISASSAYAFGQTNKVAGQQAMAIGGQNTIGQNGGVSFAVGSNNLITSSLTGPGATGGAQIAMGFRSTSSAVIAAAIGASAHAAGNSSFAQGGAYHISGSGIMMQMNASGGWAIGTGSHAEGVYTTALGNFSHAEGGGFIVPTGSFSELIAISGGLAIGSGSHAEGRQTTAIGNWSHAEGFQNVAIGDYSHAEGRQTTAVGSTTHAEGFGTTTIGIGSHAEGLSNIAIGSYSHAEGRTTTSVGQYSHAQGQGTVALDDYQFVAGQFNQLIPSKSAFIIGDGTSDSARKNLIYASGGRVDISGSLFINGTEVSAGGGGSTPNLQAVTTAGSATSASVAILANFVNGESGVASNFSHAQGRFTTASGNYSHAEGGSTTATGNWSHAEGGSTLATGQWSHAEGGGGRALADMSHAEGDFSTATELASHAEGRNTTTKGVASHTAGYYTIAGGNYQGVVGQFNRELTDVAAFIIGNGTNVGSRSNLLTAVSNTVQVTGSLLIQSASVDGEAVSNIGDTFTGTARVTKMVTCTSAEYAAIATKNPNTFYIII